MNSDFFLHPLVASLASLVIGFIWYHPKVFGTAWMKATGMTEEKMKATNPAKTYGLALLCAFFVAFILQFLSIHQTGAFSLIDGNIETALPSYQAFMDDYGTVYRTFKHGAFHGTMAGVFFALPVICTNALFEQKSAKHAFINSGYWIVTCAVMGGIVCAWV